MYMHDHDPVYICHYNPVCVYLQCISHFICSFLEATSIKISYPKVWFCKKELTLFSENDVNSGLRLW